MSFCGFICILLLISIFGHFSSIYQFSAENGMTLGHLNRIGIIQKVFEKIFQNFVNERQIDVRKAVPSFASIPVTVRTVFKKKRGGGRIRPSRRSRVKLIGANLKCETRLHSIGTSSKCMY